MNPPKLLYAFDAYAVLAQWRVVDDIVMGGHSEGHFAITEDKHGRFFGDVNLTDGSGFSSVRHRFDEPIDVSAYERVFVRVRGDGSEYLFRVKDDPTADFAYVHRFTTTGDWQIVEVSLRDMYPVRKGKRLEAENFAGRTIGEISFLISNGREQAFQLLIDRLELL